MPHHATPFDILLRISRGILCSYYYFIHKRKTYRVYRLTNRSAFSTRLSTRLLSCLRHDWVYRIYIMLVLRLSTWAYLYRCGHTIDYLATYRAGSAIAFAGLILAYEGIDSIQKNASNFAYSTTGKKEDYIRLICMCMYNIVYVLCYFDTYT